MTPPAIPWLRRRFTNRQATTINAASIQSIDSACSFMLDSHLDRGQAAKLVSEAGTVDQDRRDTPVNRKGGTKFFFAGIEVQITHGNLHFSFLLNTFWPEPGTRYRDMVIARQKKAAIAGTEAKMIICIPS